MILGLVHFHDMLLKTSLRWEEPLCPTPPPGPPSSPPPPTPPPAPPPSILHNYSTECTRLAEDKTQKITELESL